MMDLRLVKFGITRIKINITVFLILCLFSSQILAIHVFANEKFTQDDAVLLTDSSGNTVYQWQADKNLTPASLTKLVTAYLSIEKWGLDHRFHTDFFLDGKQLWVKGYGDPYLISEEIDLLVSKLKTILPIEIESIHIDTTYFNIENIPGRSKVDDPYNAPVSAIAANFNTVFLKQVNGQLVSAEPQTPLTDLAVLVANRLPKKISNRATRINLLNNNNAQKYFAELLLAKLGKTNVQIKINQNLPSEASLVYRHKNSHDLASVLTGSLKFSNNFIANQLFVLLGEEKSVQGLGFSKSEKIVQKKLSANFNHRAMRVVDGAGLSRKNKLSANQLNHVLTKLQPHKKLLKEYKLTLPSSMQADSVKVFAKTGTLSGVHCFAGFLELSGSLYQFVFMFNRSMPFNYRENLLQRLFDELVQILDSENYN